MRTLDRLVAGQFIKLFVIFVLATPPLLILAEVTEDLDRYVDLELTLMEVATGFLYRMPEYFVWSLPIAGLIASVFTVHSMTAHHEIVAAKAGGISFHRLVFPVLLLGAVIAVFGVWLTDYAAISNRTALDYLSNRDRGRRWRSEFVYQTEQGLTVSSRRLTLDPGRLTDVVVQAPGAGVPDLHVNADGAAYDEERGLWVLESGYARLIGADSSEIAYEFRRMRLPALSERPDELLDDPPEDEEMTYAELGRQAEIMRRSGGDPTELLVDKEQRFAIPAATFVVILFGAPMATTSKRGGAAFGVGVALGTTLFYLLLFQIAAGFGTAGAISPRAAAWTPNALFLAAGLLLLARVRT